ncbi:MAG: hypothetical protein ABJ239_01705 [Erythrobacter sp.]
MKFDMGQAWNSATELLGKNKDVILVVAGMFIFLPNLALSLLIPGLDQPQVNPEDTDAVFEAFREMYQEYWWALLISTLVQTVGTLSLLTLLTDNSRPTVAEAIKLGGKGLLPYVGTQILLGFGVAIVIGLPLGIAVASQIVPLVAIIGLVSVVAVIYILIKTLLITPVIAIERIYNPVAIFKRSWSLTKGNSFRLFAFFALLVIAVSVLFLIVNGILAVVLAAVGGQVQIIGTAVVSGIFNTIFAIVILAVLAGIHRQLAGPTAEDVSDTFS